VKNAVDTRDSKTITGDVVKKNAKYEVGNPELKFDAN
jgi:hypothetical protein